MSYSVETKALADRVARAAADEDSGRYNFLNPLSFITMILGLIKSLMDLFGGGFGNLTAGEVGRLCQELERPPWWAFGRRRRRNQLLAALRQAGHDDETLAALAMGEIGRANVTELGWVIRDARQSA